MKYIALILIAVTLSSCGDTEVVTHKKTCDCLNDYKLDSIRAAFVKEIIDTKAQMEVDNFKFLGTAIQQAGKQADKIYCPLQEGVYNSNSGTFVPLRCKQ